MFTPPLTEVKLYRCWFCAEPIQGSYREDTGTTVFRHGVAEMEVSNVEASVPDLIDWQRTFLRWLMDLHGLEFSERAGEQPRMKLPAEEIVHWGKQGWASVRTDRVLLPQPERGQAEQGNSEDSPELPCSGP